MNAIHPFFSVQGWTDDLIAVVGLLTFAELCVRLFRHGYLKRKPYWTRRSWYKFAILLCSSFAVIAVALAMALGVDYGVYDYLTDDTADVYFWLLVTLAVIGPSAAMILLSWFAKGRSDRRPDDDLDGSGVSARLKPRLPVLSASDARSFPRDETA